MDSVLRPDICDEYILIKLVNNMKMKELSGISYA